VKAQKVENRKNLFLFLKKKNYHQNDEKSENKRRKKLTSKESGD